MKIGNKDLDKEVLIVAEVGNNHEGSYTLAEELVGVAAEAGVGAVKFQTFCTEEFINRKSKDRFAQLKAFELKYNEFEKLSKIATQAGILFLSTPFDIESAEFLNNIVKAFKISSGDNTFYPLIEKVAGFGKPIILASGLAGLTQIEYSKILAERIWDDLGINQELAILHCVSSYPVRREEANLAAIPRLISAFQCTVGYSDHTQGIEAAVLSVALGARIVEKHFTIRKDYSGFRDHQLSADPQEMAELVQKIEHVSVLIGTGKKWIQDCERDAIGSVRRSIVAKRDLAKGEVIGWNSISWVRPSEGLSPGKEHLVLGREVLKPIRAGDPIRINCLCAKTEVW
jgi:N,N'-diacetyllegionaminate synthase